MKAIFKEKEKLTIDRSNFIKVNDGKFKDKYQLDYLIGRGAISEVYKCNNWSVMGMTRAVKIINKNYLSRDELSRLKDEMIIMQRLDHPNICKLCDVYDEDNKYMLVMEYCKNGELYDEIADAGAFTELKAANLLD